MRPTAAGLLLTEHADAIGRQVAEAETALTDLLAGRTVELSLRYFATAGARLVAPAVARLRAQQPGVRIELRLAGPDPSPTSGRAAPTWPWSSDPAPTTVYACCTCWTIPTSPSCRRPIPSRPAAPSA